MINIKTNLHLNKSEIGSSICCDGVCLTLTNIKKKKIFFYVSNETLKRSNFKNLKIGNMINLEKSLSYGQKISEIIPKVMLIQQQKLKKLIL